MSKEGSTDQTVRSNRPKCRLQAEQEQISSPRRVRSNRHGECGSTENKIKIKRKVGNFKKMK